MTRRICRCTQGHTYCVLPASPVPGGGSGVRVASRVPACAAATPALSWVCGLLSEQLGIPLLGHCVSPPRCPEGEGHLPER